MEVEGTGEEVFPLKQDEKVLVSREKKILTAENR
jgi:hypothetical protein